MNTIKAYSDGSCERGIGRMHIGVYAEEAESGKVIIYDHKPVTAADGSMLMGTCNECELYALLELILQLDKYIQENPGSYTVILHTDSLLSYSQIAGKWRVNTDELYYLVKSVRDKLTARGWELKHIPREENRIADSLSAEGRADHPKNVNSLDFSRTYIRGVAGGNGLVSSSTISKIFSDKLPALKQKLKYHLCNLNAKESCGYARDIITAVSEATAVKTTSYLDNLIKRVVNQVVNDMQDLIYLVGKGKYEEAESLLSANNIGEETNTFSLDELKEIFEGTSCIRIK